MTDVGFGNYQAPQGLMPSALTGIDSALDALARQRAQQHGLDQMGIRTLQDQANLERYRKLTPGMVDVQNLQGAQARVQNTPNMLEQFGQGQVGQWQQQQAQGKKALGTVDSDIEAGNAVNLSKSLENTARQLEFAAASGNLGAQEGYDSWRKTISPAMQKHFPAQYTPDVPARLRAISQWLIDNPEHKRATEKIDQEQSWQEQREQALAGINNAASQTRTETTALAHVAGSAANREPPAETRDKAIARLVRQNREKPGDPNVQRELGFYLNKEFADDFAKDPRGMIIASQASSNPKMAEEYENYQAWSRARYFDQHGLDNEIGQLTYDEYKWANSAMRANHGISVEQLLAEGRKRGRIKSRKR